MLSVLLIVARRDMTVVCRAVHLYSNLHLIKLPKLLETEPLLLKGRTMIILEFFCPPGIESVLYYKKTLILTVGTLPDAQEIYGQYDFLL